MKIDQKIKDKIKEPDEPELEEIDDEQERFRKRPQPEPEPRVYYEKKSKLPMQFYKFNERILILGKTQMGKTYLVQKMIKRIAKYRLVVVLDPKLEYNYPELTETAFKNKSAKGIYRITSLEVEEMEITDPYLLNEFICDNLFDRENTTLVCEEVAMYIQKHGKLYDTSPNFAKYLQQGQAKNCGLICTSQRPAEVHTNILSQSQHIIAFYMKAPHDREALKNYFDLEIYDVLDMYEFVRYQDPDKLYVHYKVS